MMHMASERARKPRAELVMAERRLDAGFQSPTNDAAILAVATPMDRRASGYRAKQTVLAIGRLVSRGYRPERPNQESRTPDPKCDDGEGCHPADRPLDSDIGLSSKLDHEVRWHHPDSKQDGERQQDHFVEISENRNEIGDEVDGRKRVGGNDRTEHLSIPGNAGITCCDPERNDIPFDAPRPALGSAQQRLALDRCQNSPRASFAVSCLRAEMALMLPSAKAPHTRFMPLDVA